MDLTNFNAGLEYYRRILSEMRIEDLCQELGGVADEDGELMLEETSKRLGCEADIDSVIDARLASHWNLMNEADQESYVSEALEWVG